MLTSPSACLQHAYAEKSLWLCCKAVHALFVPSGLWKDFVSAFHLYYQEILLEVILDCHGNGTLLRCVCNVD